MIHITNLRIVEHGEWSRLIADISSESKRSDKESTMWVGVKKENEDMLTSDVYNMFLFLPLYIAMYYKEDLYIHGPVSKRLYRNVVDYLEPIMENFSVKLKKVDIHVDGFKEAQSNHSIIGTGLSCGVDNLATIYKYYKLEDDEDYKINGLFMLNCGWHGNYYSKSTMDLFKKRCELNYKAAKDMGIPLFMLDSNLHAFLPKLDDQISYFYLYTCIFALERTLKKYYLSSSFSYNEVLKYGLMAKEGDFSEFADPYAIPLFATDNMAIISDGCQYTRSKKTELIANWDISKKYLNVCCKNDDETNCSVCAKCVRTLQPIDAMGLLEEYKDVFNIQKFKEIQQKENYKLVVWRNKLGFYSDNYHYCKSHGVKMPSLISSEFHMFPERLSNYMKQHINNKNDCSKEM